VRAFALEGSSDPTSGSTALDEEVADREEKEWTASGKARLVGTASAPVVPGRGVRPGFTTKRAARARGAGEVEQAPSPIRHVEGGGGGGGGGGVGGGGGGGGARRREAGRPRAARLGADRRRRQAHGRAARVDGRPEGRPARARRPDRARRIGDLPRQGRAPGR